MVKSSADSLLAVINDILDFSKIEAGKLDLEPIDVRPARHIWTTTLNTLALRAHEKGLELACHVPADVPDALVGDPGRLRQILVNLVGNAIKFTDAGRGRRARRRRIAHGEWRRASCTSPCRDTGIGIPADKHASALRGLLPGRQLDDAQVRRHRPGPGDLVAARRA